MPRLEDLSPDLVAATVSRAVIDAVAEGGEIDAIVARALANARQALGLDSVSRPPTAASHPSVVTPFRPEPPARPPGGPHVSGRAVVTEADVIDASRAGRTELRVSPGTLVTALARDAARDAGLRLVEA